MAQYGENITKAFAQMSMFQRENEEARRRENIELARNQLLQGQLALQADQLAYQEDQLRFKEQQSLWEQQLYQQNVKEGKAENAAGAATQDILGSFDGSIIQASHGDLASLASDFAAQNGVVVAKDLGIDPDAMPGFLNLYENQIFQSLLATQRDALDHQQKVTELNIANAGLMADIINLSSQSSSIMNAVAQVFGDIGRVVGGAVQETQEENDGVVPGSQVALGLGERQSIEAKANASANQQQGQLDQIYAQQAYQMMQLQYRDYTSRASDLEGQADALRQRMATSIALTPDQKSNLKIQADQLEDRARRLRADAANLLADFQSSRNKTSSGPSEVEPVPEPGSKEATKFKDRLSQQDRKNAESLAAALRGISERNGEDIRVTVQNALNTPLSPEDSKILRAALLFLGDK